LDACVPDVREAIFADNAVLNSMRTGRRINIDEAPNYPVISQKIPALHDQTVPPGRVKPRAVESSSYLPCDHKPKVELCP